MELPWLLLALAGMSTAADLGDSPGDRAEGDRGLEGLRGVCAREGFMGLGTAGGSPHRCCPPHAGTL